MSWKKYERFAVANEILLKYPYVDNDIKTRPIIDALFEHLHSAEHVLIEYGAMYSGDKLGDIVFFNCLIHWAEYGINIVASSPFGEPVVISINFDGKIYGSYQGYINMDGDPHQ